jgi:predicted DNA-binding transcriptional regulator YafY
MAKPAKKYSQAARVHDIIRLIEARHGVTLSELAEETGVNRRTIHRDLAVIQEAGYPLISIWQDGVKIYRFLTRFKDVPPIAFTLQELMSLHLLRAQAEQLQGTPIHDDISAVFRKIRSVLPPRYAAHLERIAGVSVPLLQGQRDYRRSSAIIEKLRHALLYQYRITLRYRAQGRARPAAYHLDPYTLVLYKGGLYLIGYAHNRQAIRTFAIERVSSVTVEQERFELPESYHPEERFQKAFGIVGEEEFAVVVRFDAAVAASVADRRWHPSQKLRKLADGGVEVSFTAGGKLEILSWVLSYGSHAEMLAPAALRDELAGMTVKMMEYYR